MFSFRSLFTVTFFVLGFAELPEGKFKHNVQQVLMAKPIYRLEKYVNDGISGITTSVHPVITVVNTQMIKQYLCNNMKL